MNESVAIALMSHAESDLISLAQAVALLPLEFPLTVGINLATLNNQNDMRQLLETRMSNARLVIVRVLGRISSVPGFSELASYAKAFNCAMVVVSGTGELDPELTCISNVDPALTHETLAYFQAGGADNLAQLLRFLADRLMMTGFGYEAPVPLPEHGVYHPDLPHGATLGDWCKMFGCDKPTVGITFYRAHWLTGNILFIDEMVRALESRGLRALPIFTSSLRAVPSDDEGLPPAWRYFLDDNGPRIDTLINTTAFAMGEVSSSGQVMGTGQDAFAILDVPTLQAIACASTMDVWGESTRGLNPLDVAMNVVLPEFDGRIITVPIAFKEKNQGLTVANYATLPDRSDRVAGIAKRISILRRKDNASKKLAFILTNSSSKASQIGNAVGLDAPQSVLNLLTGLAANGYDVGDVPLNSKDMMHELIDRCSYDQTLLSASQYGQALGRVCSEQYKNWFAELPEQLQADMVRQWGAQPGRAYVYGDELIIAGITLGNVALVLQPPRGYGMDENAIYHKPDLPPTHHYYAFYRWLERVFEADALVHIGKHGTLEWLPGKSVGLSKNCFPDALLADLPLFYPFILNDPGEGSQAKRRSHATIVDHLMPVMTSAETYGVLADLTQLVDEYYQVEMLDPAKLPLLQQQIWDLIKEAKLDEDLKFILAHDDDHDDDDHGCDDDHDDHDDDHDDHDDDHAHDHHQEWQDELAPHGVPISLAQMNGVKVSHLIQDIDGYLCELGAAQIRDGLHTLGEAPKEAALVDMLCSLTRLPNLEIPSLPSEVAKIIGLDLDDLLKNKGAKLQQPKDLAELVAGRDLISKADALETIDMLCNRLIGQLGQNDYREEYIDKSIKDVFAPLGDGKDWRGVKAVLKFVCDKLVIDLNATGDEIDNLLKGLEGRYVPPGPSGAPTRGMAHILPTGKNFYSVDPRTLPSNAAWRVGEKLADEVVNRHLKEAGTYPETVGISVWGTSAMRTHGDDVAEILALLGVRPLWQSENRRLSGIEVIPIKELGRPRIDVTVRISGFFRDAFQHLIDLIDQAVQAVIIQDEALTDNFVRKHYLEDLERLTGAGVEQDAAERRSSYRIFGAKPGSYGAGILPLINEKNWHDEHDFAEAYVNWGGYVYGSNLSGVDARDDFRERLGKVEIAIHNQDNREHDIFDSDDYLQFHGGMIATIKSLTGRQPKHYFGDTHDPGHAAVRDLKQEALRVFRSRVVNPKWLTSIKRHGYKGGLELTATVDYLFGYDATADILSDWMYEQVAQTYALASDMREFLSENNPWALNAITERLLEAAKRGMWAAPEANTLAELTEAYLASEAALEARGDKARAMEVVL